MSAPQPGRLLRCGWTDQPVLYSIEADGPTIGPIWRSRDFVALCCAELGEDTPVPDFDGDCPGCQDCMRYCARCVRHVVEFCEQPRAEVYVGQLRVPDLLLAGRG